jgi:Ca-activated chloride channel family protein
VGNKRGEYMRDAEGQVVTTTINEKLAKEIAEAGGGIYVNGGSTSALSDLMAQLETLQKSEFKRVSYNAGAEQFPTFAWFAFILLLIDTFILDRKISWLKNVNFFSK